MLFAFSLGLKGELQNQGPERCPSQRITRTEINLKCVVLHGFYFCCCVSVFSHVICDHMNLPWEILQQATTVLVVTQLVVPA